MCGLAGWQTYGFRHASESWHLRRLHNSLPLMRKGGFVYILTNKRYGVLYTGVTSDLAARIFQHREGKGGQFTSRYKATTLVYVEEYPTIEEAIAREKAIKAWKRTWKIEAIERMNPGWQDLYLLINA